MAVQLVDNFDLSSKKPLDSRAYWETLAKLQANRTILMPNGFLAYVEDKKCYYIMSCTNPADPSTYTWSEFKTGSTGGSGTTGPTYTPGDNIQISADNKISATDTKYTFAADESNPMKVVLTNASDDKDKQSVEIPIHTTAVEGYPTPVGTIILYNGLTPPEGYLLCDGSTYNIADYPELVDQIKINSGSVNAYGGDGTTTFAVPTNISTILLADHTTEKISATTVDGDTSYTDLRRPIWEYTNNGTNVNFTINAKYTNGNASGAFIQITVDGVSKWTSSTVSGEDSIDINTAVDLPAKSKIEILLCWDGQHGNNYVAKLEGTYTIKNYAIYCIKYRSDTVLNNAYSTDETVVGRWIDGKPIYRKAYKHTKSGEQDLGLTVKEVDTITKLDNFYRPDDYGMTGSLFYSASKTYSSYLAVVNGKYMYIWDRIEYGFVYGIVVIEYTKTADDANTIPAGSHPSTYTEYSTVATDEEVNLALQ